MNKDSFLSAVNTLKLYRRAELINEEGQQLIKALYVDPLPDEYMLKTVLRPNTTFIYGRKGTGKSTIFQRAHEALNSDKHTTWAYIDIKTLFESSTSELMGNVAPEHAGGLSPEAIRKLAIFKSFILELVREIKNQIHQRVDASLWAQFKEAFTGSASELFERLDEFVEDLEQDKYLNVTGSVQSNKKDADSAKSQSKFSSGTSGAIGANPSVKANVLLELVRELEQKRSQNYSQIFIRVFNIRGLIERLREILSALRLRHIYIFIDDFSELPREDMEEVVDTILGPFNNWSDEFIKLKVAVYPGRLYPGEIDLSKVDELYLDIYRAYGRDDVTGMEDKAIDFTRRLVLKRLSHFCSEPPETFLEVESPDFWRTLFYSCLGNPRILGYVLYYGFETNVIYGKRIGIRTIQVAARRYYEEKIDHNFRLNKFLHEAFSERSSIFSLKELLEELVKRAKALRSYKDSRVMRDLSGRAPTSHFHVIREYDGVLSTLELNFFLTKFYEMRNRDGKEVSVYCLHYGLCQQESIAFGRPQETREQRLYFIERIFDYSPIIASYIKVNQEILCDNCRERHAHDMLPAIQAFDMLCPKCRQGTCRIVNLSRKYEKLIRDVADESLLPQTEIGILKTLHDERRRMFAAEIAAELDCSYQLVGKRGRNLAERDLVARTEEKGRRVFELSARAESVYFESVAGDGMEFGDSDASIGDDPSKS